MKVLGKPKAIIIYGPPGAGKGTQADLVARHFGYIHFDTGKYLESVVYNKDYKNDPIIQNERVAFETGKLMTPSWVLEVVKAQAKRIAKANIGIVFSGSPRTLYEAKKLVPTLEKLYGRENILFFLINVTPADSIKRNSNRLLCSICGTQLIHNDKSCLTACPFCGGSFIRRTLDKPEIIKKRIIEYNLRTKPIFEEVRSKGYNIFKINGKLLPNKVFENIRKKIF